MSDQALETIERNGYTAQIYADTDCESPREWGDTHVGVLVLDHKRYDLPQESEAAKRALDHFTSFELFVRWARIYLGATVVLPVWGYDHSGLTVHAGDRSYPFSDPWDSGLLGVVFDTAETREATGVPLDRVEQALRAEVDEYDQWGRGECYCYVIEDRNGDTADSCGGFIGYEYALEATEEALDNLGPQPEKLYTVRLTADQLTKLGRAYK